MTDWIYALLYHTFIPAAAFTTGLILLSYGISKALSLFDIKNK